MSNRSALLYTFPHTDGVQTVEVTLHYPTMSGLRRAYVVSAQPLTRRDGITRYYPMDGLRFVVEDSPRYNARKLAALAETPYVRAIARSLALHVGADPAHVTE